MLQQRKDYKVVEIDVPPVWGIDAHVNMGQYKYYLEASYIYTEDEDGFREVDIDAVYLVINEEYSIRIDITDTLNQKAREYIIAEL